MPTSGTTGRSKLVMQTHRAYALAGEGFPYWMELRARRPADDLAAAVPHQRARVLGARARCRCGAGLVLLPRFSASGFLDSARRHGATEFNAIGAMLEILMRQPERPDDADTDLRLCYTGPSPAREWQEAFERRFGLRVVVRVRDVGVAVRADLAARRAPVRHARHRRASTRRLGTVNEARVVGDDGGEVAPGGTGELLLRNPVRHARATGRCRRRPRRPSSRRLAAHRRPGHPERRRHIHVRGAEEGGAAPARGEPLAGRGGGGDRGAPGRAGGARSSACRRS